MSHPDPHDFHVTVVASVSGGKDSTALSLWLTEQGIEHKRVFADTGWEADETVRYVYEYLPEKIGDIDVVRAEKYDGFEGLCLDRAMFPSRLLRFCTQELKVAPIGKYLKRFDTEVVNVVGIRAAESASRAKMPEWEYFEAFDAWTWRPLLRWTLDDVIDIHKRHGLDPNPLYLHGHKRVGCYPCIYSDKAELRLIAERAPGRIDRIRHLEGRVTREAVSRDRNKSSRERTMFHKESPGQADRTKHPMPIIDEAVEWARTSRGGRQLLLLNDDGREGCMRWGLCGGTEGE